VCCVHILRRQLCSVRPLVTMRRPPRDDMSVGHVSQHQSHRLEWKTHYDPRLVSFAVKRKRREAAVPPSKLSYRIVAECAAPCAMDRVVTIGECIRQGHHAAHRDLPAVRGLDNDTNCLCPKGECWDRCLVRSHWWSMHGGKPCPKREPRDGGCAKRNSSQQQQPQQNRHITVSIPHIFSDACDSELRIRSSTNIEKIDTPLSSDVCTV
jgi:hypothetical protein